MEEVFAEMPILGEIAERQGVKADLAGMSVHIEHEQGRFSGDIEVEARIKAKIRGNCIWRMVRLAGQYNWFPLMSVKKED